jgi:hypothetical protein
VRRARWGWLLALALAGGLPTAGRAGAGDATLLVDVQPREPWVGEPVVLRVRLVLSRDLAEEPTYSPPVANGFWTEAASRAESYYDVVGGRRVLVTETRTRLYPLSPGRAQVGAAAVDVLFAEVAGQRMDRAARERTLRSEPVVVQVRPLPPGAPVGFDGAVGQFTVGWSADRERTPQDVPVVVRLDVRGTGNLALLKVPSLVVPDAEVLAGVRDDSLPSPGSGGAGRVRFHWDVLAGRRGSVALAPPGFAWFDPGAGAYRSVALPPLRVEVGAPLFSGGPGRGEFPAALGRDTPDPFARGPRAWWWGLAGLLLGMALALWRARPAADPLAGDRARVAAWRHLLRGAEGPAFWRAAEEAVDWLLVAGRPLAELRALITSTRYGGEAVGAEGVRARLLAELGSALPRRRGRMPWRALAVVLAVAAVTVPVATMRPGGGDGAARLIAADRLAREGEVARARAAWAGLWSEGAHAPALAARLAWVDLATGRLAPATVWVLRGDRAGARDGALGWVANLVREGGGLAGARGRGVPLRPVEWAVLAWLLGAAAGLAWPRRGAAVALVVLTLIAAGAGPVDEARLARRRPAVVARASELAGSGLELEVGQVVEVIERRGISARVRVGRDLSGLVRADGLLPVEELP